jgi:D-sedoheptulose 7-phosphate isomerase
MKQSITSAYKTALNLALDFYNNPKTITITEEIAGKIASTFENGHKVLICGNGGSMCDAMHFAEEFTGRFRKDRKPLPAIALSDPSHITCVGNDYGFDEIFARGVAAYGKSNDLLIGISTSGNSSNIIKAIKQAKKQKMHTIGLLGKDGGLLKTQCDQEIIAPGVTTDRIQEIHMTILHIIIEAVERTLFPENY